MNRLSVMPYFRSLTINLVGLFSFGNIPLKKWQQMAFQHLNFT